MITVQSVVRGVLWLVLTAPLTHAHAQRGCELQQGHDTVLVTGTPWIVAVRGYACGFGIGVTVDLVAINTNTKTVKVLAKGDDLKTETMLLDNSGNVVINIPNTSDISVISSSFDGINVIYKYYPYDDPEEREGYFNWTQDRKNENNRIWYCAHIFPKMAPMDQYINDEVLAYSVYGRGDSRKSYCKSQ
jgi:hypothetical protein